jgi:antitoxin ParD1/3/4
MAISLKPEQQAWIAAHVAQGDFATPEEAALQLIDESIAGRADIEYDDLAWAKPFVDEALTEVERGEVLTRDEHEARMDGLLASLKG